MDRSTIFPPTAGAPGPATSEVFGSVVHLAFDGEGVVATPSGRRAISDVQTQGTRTVVITVPGLPIGTVATAVPSEGADVRVDGPRVVYSVAAGLPTSGAVVLLLTEPRGSAKRATLSLAPAPPTAFSYMAHDGAPSTLAFGYDVRTQRVRIEATDAAGAVEGAVWFALRTVDVDDVDTIELSVTEDAPGRTFRAVALRTVNGDELESAPSNSDYRNGPPVSIGAATRALAVGEFGRIPLAGLLFDSDGRPMTYRPIAKHAPLGKAALPSWLTLDGSVVVVSTKEPHEAVTIAIAGTDEKGATATLDFTISVYTPDGPDTPGAVVFVQ
ncbi:MAG TPA: hypothetical protein VF594_10995 [Rubricoccaceae bacterium]